MKKKTVMALGTLALTVCLLTGGYLLWCRTLKDNVIWADYEVNGISLMGMTKKEALLALDKEFEESFRQAVLPVVLDNERYETEIFPLLTFDGSDAVEEAYLPGHRQWYKRGLDKYRLRKQKTKRLTVYPELLDSREDGLKKTKELLEDTGIHKVDTLVETTWEQQEAALVIHKGKAGVKADMERLCPMFLEALEKHAYTEAIACPVIEKQPKELALKPLYEAVYQEARDATLDEENGYALVESQNAVSFDLEEAERLFEEAEEGETIVVAYDIREPENTTKVYQEKLFRDVLGSYSTYGGGTASRIQNITLAAESCNGVILMPGEVFSYNGALGERTVERGYGSATVYVNGTATQGIGGGICQVSSTLFAALLQTSLPIEERQNHSLTVGYLPLGMDAAVSWGGPDLCFQNNTKYPLKINVTYDSGEIHAEILGTKENSQSVTVTTESVGPLAVKTYRNYYDADGNLQKTQEVAYSQYKGRH